jgi:hypothetical protein
MKTRLAYNVTNICNASADTAPSPFHHEMIMIKTFVTKLSTFVSGSNDHHKSQSQNLVIGSIKDNTAFWAFQ